MTEWVLGMYALGLVHCYRLSYSASCCWYIASDAWFRRRVTLSALGGSIVMDGSGHCIGGDGIGFGLVLELVFGV